MTSFTNMTLHFVRKDHFQWKILKNSKNTYGLSFYPDHIHKRKTFVGQEITILWQEKYS